MWLCVYCLIHTKNPTFLSQFCICTIQNVTNFDRNVSTLWKPEEDIWRGCARSGKHYESSLKFGCPCATLRLTRSPSRLATSRQTWMTFLSMSVSTVYAGIQPEPWWDMHCNAIYWICANPLDWYSIKLLKSIQASTTRIMTRCA